jgi:glycosyltransferase involved in cell wall biosynthesis
MMITVAINTWNRAGLLDQTLSRMHALVVPTAIEWELLVVNNNCTDDTDVVIARHRGRLPLRRLFEPRLGVSHAKNRAIDAARGDLMLWTDDDVMVAPDWMIAYLEAAARWPAASFFGGTIEPWFEIPPPGWVLENLDCLRGMLAAKEIGPEERYYSEGDRPPFGANMAFRTEVLKAHRFDTNLGRTGGDQVRGEETALIEALCTKGIRGVWVPGARVEHFVTRQRLTRRYLWDYFRGLGQSHIRQSHVRRDDPDGGTWGGVPRWLIREAIEAWTLAQWKRLWSRTGWVPAYARAATTTGMIVEYRRRAGNRPRIGTGPGRPDGARCNG